MDKDEALSNGMYTFEQAIRLARIGKYQTVLIILTGLSVMGTVLENVSVSYVLPFVKCDLKLSLYEQGLLNSVSYVGIVVSSHFWGFMADTWGRQKVIRLAAFGGFICSCLSAFAMNTTLLIVFRFLAGLFVSGIQAGAFSYISEFHTIETAPRAASFITIFMSGTWIYLSAIAYVLIPMDWNVLILNLEFKPWRLFLVCVSLCNLFNFIMFSCLPESPKFLLLMNKKDEALGVLRKMHAINTGESKEQYPVKEIVQVSFGNGLGDSKGLLNLLKLVWNQTIPIFQTPLLGNTLKLCYIIFAMFLIGHGTFMWFPDILVQLQNYGGPKKTLCEIVGHKTIPSSINNECDIDNKNTLSFEIMAIVGIIFMTTSGLMSFNLKKIGAKKLVGVWLVVSTVCCILLNYLNDFYAIVVAFVTFLSCCLCATIVTAVAVNLYPSKYRAMATSFIFMFGRVGGATGGNFIRFILEENCNLLFYVFGGFLLSCNIVFLLVKANKSTDEIAVQK